MPRGILERIDYFPLDVEPPQDSSLLEIAVTDNP